VREGFEPSSRKNNSRPILHHARSPFGIAQTRVSHKNSRLIRVEPSPSIPQELRKLYGYLSSALTEAHESLRALERLYLNDDVVALLNSTAPEFFALLQQLLVHNIILYIARLTDEPETGGRENLTLSRLVLELSSNQKYSELRTRLDEKCKRIEKMSCPIRLYRHKLLAHADRVEGLTPNTKLGKEISILTFRKLLKQIADFLNTFDYEFTNAETDYADLIRTHGDVTNDFIAYLRKNIVKRC
jgi:AbiU2